MNNDLSCLYTNRFVRRQPQFRHSYCIRNPPRVYKCIVDADVGNNHDLIQPAEPLRV